MLPGKQTYELLNRYINIARYSTYKKQITVFGKLRDQYPSGTRFVILPMDMEYMGAGKTDQNYAQQMEELKEIKRENSSIFYPFVFVDPRRVEAEKDDFFAYDLDASGKQVLRDCFVKRFIETEKFSGFKIYPALGYYPFDTRMLKIWKYAADNNLPIMTHCIRGTYSTGATR